MRYTDKDRLKLRKKAKKEIKRMKSQLNREKMEVVEEFK